jgi:Cu-Zn family superoxide dismutase
MPSSTNNQNQGPAPAVSLFGNGVLAPPGPHAKAITYNPSLAPTGAAVTAVVVPSSNGSMTATLAVSGLLPNRGYAAHAHMNPCGATGEAAGAHFENHQDPSVTPPAASTNPEYANPKNEIWLDVHTDAAGAGTATTTVPFILTGNRMPGSIVIHEAMQTETAPGHAGQAGARIACVTLAK